MEIQGSSNLGHIQSYDVKFIPYLQMRKLAPDHRSQNKYGPQSKLGLCN